MSSVTISVVSHGHGKMVAALLNDLRQQTISHEFRVMLTLNIAEPEPDAGVCDGIDLAIIRNSSPKGFGANHNAALANADTPWVVVINPDIRISDTTLFEKLLQARSEKLGLTAPEIFNSKGEIEDSVRSNIDPITILLRRLAPPPETAEASRGRFFWIAGMFMAFPLPAWRAVGGFDERFFLYCEDYDICARLVTSGYRIKIADGLRAVHDAQRTSHKSFKYMRWHITSLLKVWASGYFWQIWLRDLSTKTA